MLGLSDESACLAVANSTIERKPRLVNREYAKHLIDSGELPSLTAEYLAWVRYSEYMVLRGVHQHDVEALPRHLAVKMAKRGNDVYHHRVLKRLGELLELQDIEYFNYKDRSSVQHTQCLYVTLTVRRELPPSYAWESIGELWAGYVDRLEKRYGGLDYLRVWESHEDGYPHIHALLFFEVASFEAFHYNGEWRVQEKADLEWEHGHVDVVAVSSTRGGVAYLTKYLGKLHSLPSEPGLEGSDVGSGAGFKLNLSSKTLAIMWAFKKRSFALTRGVVDLIRALHNSERPRRQVQVDLDMVPVWRWFLAGFWGGVLKKWAVELSPSEFRALAGSPTYTARAVSI